MLENCEEYLYQGSTKRDLATSTTGASVVTVAAACSCIDKEATYETTQENHKSELKMVGCGRFYLQRLLILRKTQTNQNQKRTRVLS